MSPSRLTVQVPDFGSCSADYSGDGWLQAEPWDCPRSRGTFRNLTLFASPSMGVIVSQSIRKTRPQCPAWTPIGLGVAVGSWEDVGGPVLRNLPPSHWSPGPPASRAGLRGPPTSMQAGCTPTQEGLSLGGSEVCRASWTRWRGAGPGLGSVPLSRAREVTHLVGPLCHPWSPGQCTVSQLRLNPLETPWAWMMGATGDTVHPTHGMGTGEKTLGFKGSVRHSPSSPPSPGGGSKCPQWALILRRPGLTTEGQRQHYLKGSSSADHPAQAPALWRAGHPQGSVAWGPTGGGPVEGWLSTILSESTLVPWRGACLAPSLWKRTPPPALQQPHAPRGCGRVSRHLCVQMGTDSRDQSWVRRQRDTCAQGDREPVDLGASRKAGGLWTEGAAGDSARAPGAHLRRRGASSPITRSSRSSVPSDQKEL